MTFQEWLKPQVRSTEEFDDYTRGWAESAWDAATLAERWRCVRIAEIKVERPWPETAVDAATEIAARIRNGYVPEAAIRGQDAQ